MNHKNHTPLVIYIFVIFALLGSFITGWQPVSAAAASPVMAPVAAPQAGLACQTLQPGPTAARDAYIKQEKLDERQGGSNELKIKTENGKLIRSLLQFDLPAIPAGSVIGSATLYLWVKEVKDGGATIAAHQVTKSWNEAQVTWKARDKAANLLWTNLGGDYNFSAVLDSVTVVKDVKNYWADWDVTAAAASWAANPAANYGLLLESPVTSPKNETKFKSSDDGTASQRPKLEICYAPGLTIEPDHNAEGVAGDTRYYSHTVSLAGLAGVVNLSAASSLGWTTRIYADANQDGTPDNTTPITQTPTLPAGGTYGVVVAVDIPPATPTGRLDTTTVTAALQANPAIRETAADLTRVGNLLDLTSDNAQYALAGATMLYTHVLVNNSGSRDCFNLSADSSQGWDVRLLLETWKGTGRYETPLTTPVCLEPGQAAYLAVEVKVDPAAAAGTVDRTTIIARSGNDPNKADTATDTTIVFVNDPPVIDGKYDDIYKISPNATQVCYSANGTLFGKLASFYVPAGDYVYMVLAIDKDFVDNTYGDNAIGWPSGHDFGNLTGSDHAQFLGYDANGTLVLDIKQDYITSAPIGPTTPSGYDSLGVIGGEGKVNLGSAAHIVAWATSEDYNLNNTGYCTNGNCAGLGTDLEVDSPATDAVYSPNSTYPEWVYDVIYELKISKLAFPNGFGSLEVPYIHASPSKLGENTIYAEPGACPAEIGDTVWNDANHDGIQDIGEGGIGAVQVQLYDDNGDGVFNPAADTLLGARTTSPSGRYLFEDLTPGDYFVDVVDATVPANYVLTTHNDPTDVITLAEGEAFLTADFGYTPPFGDIELVKELSSPDASVRRPGDQLHHPHPEPRHHHRAPAPLAGLVRYDGARLPGRGAGHRGQPG